MDGRKDSGPPRFSRRAVLGVAGGVGAWMLTRPWQRPLAQQPPPCALTPEQTQGPYFRDVNLERTDIRVDPTDGSVSAGVPLALSLRVLDLADGCRPVAGAVVDLWQCDAFGRYAGVRDLRAGFDAEGSKFLRGYQVTDDTGTVRFVTVFPGWYPVRTVHIHFKVRTEPDSPFGREFSSQLYFDDALTDRVHARPPYAQRGPRPVTNDRDGLFRDGGERLLLHVGETTAGLAARFEVGLQEA